ncbi:MAG TPA: type II secretion system protein [Solirubrobacterales bacterium]|jgi:type II secretory pathway pseudopilin PulG|nr:type II secretion system protein [Solirubrobacterales bacterium]
MPVKAQDESGFTMIMTVIGISLVALLATVAVTAVNGSAQVTGRDIARKQAYEAALAGINEYAYHLHANSGYWAECTNAVPKTEASALNQEGSTANRRPVPGETGATYALELLPATGHSSCDPTNIETATASMLEALEPMKGTFRVRATGFSGTSQVSVTGTFKPASFLDYVYFTQLETSDPVTYGYEELVKAAGRQCIKTIHEGRYEAALTNASGSYLNAKGEVLTNKNGEYVNSKNERGSLQYCDTISFVGGDNIKGPMHTNDAFVICESPTLGRTASDPIEVSAPEPGWYSTRQISTSGSNCTGHNTNFKGTFRVNSPVLIPPETNSELETIAEPTFRFSGEIKICLEGAKLTVGSGKSCTGSVLYSGAFPANGVIYDSSQSCSGAYTPFAVNYESTGVGTCGNVNVEGKYAKPLTIAAANDVLIMNNIEKSSEEGMLGLIANNFIRIYHPVKITKTTKTVNGVSVTEESCTSSSENLSGSVKNLRIEAALLAIKHSFIVDNYNCGPQLEKLNVKGAIAQKFRGAVGTTGSTGYLKNYEYDERLKTTEPPSFIEPIKSDWVIGRETTE